MNLNAEELMKLDKEEIIVVLLAVIKSQAEKIAELEARLNQNSSNSSKPPSSDGFNKPKSLRKPSGKKAGGQAGHEGSGLKITQQPDKIVGHMPTQCEGCAKYADCRERTITSEVRYEIDIEVKPVVTAHEQLRVKCPKSGECMTGEFPLGISGTLQYGVNLEALAVSLNTMGMVSINRTHEILSGVFGVPISTGTIAGMVKNCAEAVKTPVSQIKAALTTEPTVHFDETGTRVDGTNYWAHSASTSELTYISVENNRGVKGMNNAGILPNFKGTAVHDCWSPYFMYGDMEHGLCNVHLLRELNSAIENHGQEWAQDMADLLLEVKKTKETLVGLGKQKASELMLNAYNSSYDIIVEEALRLNPVPVREPNQKGRIKRGKVGALVDRIAGRKEEYLLFFNDFTVPFDNNQAERDIRMFKVKQKVSGCFRTKDGANNFAAIMSFIGTARKKGFSAFNAIKDALLGKPFDFSLIGATE